MMLPETLQLEKLRQQIEDAEYEAGNQSDYLDRGNPSAQQSKAAQETIARMELKSKELKAELHALIETLRMDKPEAIREWAQYHQGILQRILTETGNDTLFRVRQNVARETSKAWEQVLAGAQEYVGINWYYLKDYKAEVRKQGGKAWWKFWG